jgi:predicted MFS family arabinose efflux permease
MADSAAPAFSSSQVWATVALGSGLGCISPLQPILLGAMLDAGRLSVGAMGQAATAELVGMALAMTVAALWLPPLALRRLAALSLAAAAIANLLTPFADGAAILACRAVSGLASGLVLWILVGMVGRLASAARTFAIYVTVQAVLTLALSALMSGVVVPRFGPLGGYGVLFAIDLLLLALAVPRIAAAYPVGEKGARGLPPPRGLGMLLAVACLLAGIMAFWVYAIPLLRWAGLGEDAIRFAMPIAIACQIAGGLFSSIMADRIRPSFAWAGGATLAIAALALVFLAPGFWTAAVGLFAACWMAIPAFQVPLLVAVDPSLRSALLIGSAQLGGMAIGPAVAAAFVGADGPGAALAVGVVLIILSVAILPLPFIGLGQRSAGTSVPQNESQPA